MKVEQKMMEDFFIPNFGTDGAVFVLNMKISGLNSLISRCANMLYTISNETTDDTFAFGDFSPRCTP